MQKLILLIQLLNLVKEIMEDGKIDLKEWNQIDKLARSYLKWKSVHQKENQENHSAVQQWKHINLTCLAQGQCVVV